MAKFIYRMQSILDIKVKMEEQAKAEFAAARIRLNAEEERLQELITRKASYEDQGRMLRKNELKVMEIIENRDALALMEEFITFQKSRVMKARELLEEARIKLQTAMQESKTQERLKEKAFDEFMREENAREAKEIDELTSYTHGRK